VRTSVRRGGRWAYHLQLRQRYEMALILAVDPERRQHAALACLARELEGHELLSASSCDDALAALDRRSPDLVLLPLLLPEAEEGELLSRLRAHAGGSDVRALSIPLLKLTDAAPPPPSAHPAWLDQILHPKDDADNAAEECEPSVFADLIRGYLETARQAAADAAAAVAELAKGLAEERRARLIAAAHATTTWVRARRDRWAVESPSVAARPPALMAAPVAEREPAIGPASVAERQAAIEPATPQPAFTNAPVEEFHSFAPAGLFAMSMDTAPTEEDGGPSLIARVTTRLRALGTFGAAGQLRRLPSLRALGSPIVRWLPHIAVAAVVLTLGVTGRAYWLKASAAPKVGVAVLESLPSGSQVLVDGEVIGLTPITTSLSVGPHRVDFKYRAKSRTLDLVIAQGGRTTELVDWSPKTTGRMQVNSEPSGARVVVDGVARGVTPLTLDDLNLGSHIVVLESAAGSVKRSVTVKADDGATVTETIYAGWLKVFSPFDLTITEGTRALRLDDRYQIMLPPGPHELRFENRALGYQEVRRVEVQPGITTPISIVAPRSTLTLSTNAPAEVIIDGVSAGQTPLVNVSVELGTRDVMLKSAAGDRRLSVAVTVKPVVLEVDLSKP
jgi:CheY-like chemotaxis protein